ncbi:SDR family NAD(P)-dependent oxidoreductase [Allochromatium palmeri]|uniref:SDR family NAD(P)-dependent oxidoreductase n=1 Tax=Allochromatium palmeri TaxID=231048 RepID=UPI002483B1A6|nr:SDR family NAD(P)-dependent oxidoreductase [Allochromatium palmeri]
MKRLDGKTALVTGAARGIGAAIASAFVEHGAYVYLTDLDEVLVQSVATALGPRAGYFHLDVREEQD